MLAFLVVLLLPCSFVAINALTDRGVRERRKVQPIYGSLLEEMAAFERSGGRLQEIDDQVIQLRRMSRKFVVAPFALAVIVTLGLTWLGVPIWVPAALIGLYVITAGATHWLVAELFGITDGRGPRTRLATEGAIVSLVAKGAIAAAGIVVAAKAVTTMNDGVWSLGIALSVVAVLLVTYCYVPVTIVDRRLQRHKEVDFAHTTRTDGILLLRSFADDDLRLFSPYGSFGPRWRFVPGRKRFEEILASALIGRSDLVAVGRPGEKLPMLGASRTYWDHDNWRDAIKSTASRTNGLLVLAGQTPSLGWEVTQLSDLGLLGKSLIVFPPDDPQGTLERYQYIDGALHLEPQHRLPDDLKTTLVALTFDDRGRPVHYVSGGRDWASYITAVVHFQMVLDGEIQYEDEGSVALAVVMAKDPFYKAAYLLRHDDRDLAESIVADALSDATDLETVIGEAWAAVAFRQDFERARDLLSDRVRAGDDDVFLRALEAVDQVADGGDDMDILHARVVPPATQADARIRVGSTSLGRLKAFQLQRMIEAIGTAEEQEDQEAAREQSGRLLHFTEGLGVSTLVAFAQVQLGESEFELGNLDAAASLFREAASLRDAPRVQISTMLPRLEPVDTVDEALHWLVRVADADRDIAGRNIALQDLLDFRSKHRSSESAAWAAEQLGRSWGESNDLEQASRYLAKARVLYTRAGRLENIADVAQVQARAARLQGRYEEANEHVIEAMRNAQTADNQNLRLDALKEAGLLFADSANPSHDSQKATEAYNDALELARELGVESEIELLERKVQSLQRRTSTTGTMFDLFNARTRRITVRARESARDRGHDQIRATHVLLGLLEELGGGAGRLLDRAGASPGQIRQETVELVGASNSPTDGHIPFAPDTKDVLFKGFEGAKELEHGYVGSDHVLLGLSSVESDAKAVLVRHGISRDWLLNEMGRAAADPDS